jgi:hypothetical protein
MSGSIIHMRRGWGMVRVFPDGQMEFHGSDDTKSEVFDHSERASQLLAIRYLIRREWVLEHPDKWEDVL